MDHALHFLFHTTKFAIYFKIWNMVYDALSPKRILAVQAVFKRNFYAR